MPFSVARSRKVDLTLYSEIASWPMIEVALRSVEWHLARPHIASGHAIYEEDVLYLVTQPPYPPHYPELTVGFSVIGEVIHLHSVKVIARTSSYEGAVVEVDFTDR